MLRPGELAECLAIWRSMTIDNARGLGWAIYLQINVALAEPSPLYTDTHQQNTAARDLSVRLLNTLILNNEE